MDQFVYENGRWPESWQELDGVSFTSDGLSPLNQAASDGAELQGRDLEEKWQTHLPDLQTLPFASCVEIDFSPNVEGIVSQDPMQFEAIKPIGPYFEYRLPHVEYLQETLRKAHKGLLPNADPAP